MENPYEDPPVLAAYVLFHYGTARDALGSLPGPENAAEFPLRCVRELLNFDRLPRSARALDLGCAVGGSTFELSRFCQEVIGVDFSAAFIRAAESLRLESRFEAELLEQGDQTWPFQARLPAGVHPERVRFQRGDALQLPETWTGFDVVLAANLLCRLSEPRRLLERFSRLIPSGGQLLLTTPFTWLESFTPRARWIQGAGALKEILSPDFTLEHETELPFLIREHARKFQYGIAWGTCWRRR
ncbi:MAG TPA: methyltransferase domain-containing protein [Chthoniobacterales bacterium]